MKLVKLNADSHTPDQKSLTPEDEKVWNSYIGNLYSKPEHRFQPPKGRDESLKFSLDLHGMTVQQAFNAVRQFLEEHRINGSKTAVVISGKSGKIADELPLWIANIEYVRKCEPILDSVGKAGAYSIYFYARGK